VNSREHSRHGNESAGRAPPALSVVRGGWEALGPEARAVRMAVFVTEQGIAADRELDQWDALCVHAVVRDRDGSAIATGRLLPDGRIGRMAVLAPWRGRGLGRMVLESLLAAARERGSARVFLYSQADAVGFYERAGFIAEGPRFLEENIEHQAMSLVFEG
jgi:predicted GNAT family N-acyltransferase